MYTSLLVCMHLCLTHIPYLSPKKSLCEKRRSKRIRHGPTKKRCANWIVIKETYRYEKKPIQLTKDMYAYMLDKEFETGSWKRWCQHDVKKDMETKINREKETELRIRDLRDGIRHEPARKCAHFLESVCACTWYFLSVHVRDIFLSRTYIYKYTYADIYVHMHICIYSYIHIYICINM